MDKRKPRISRAILQWLFVLMALALVATTGFLWVSQTRLSENNAERILQLNLADVLEDINDASDENLLDLSRQVAADLNELERIDASDLARLAEAYDVTEINVIDSDGIITATTNPLFQDYDMRSGAQSAEFMVLLEGESEYVQRYQPVSYDESIQRKYGGAVLADGGFVQVGYDAERFQRDIDQFVVGVTRNRHVGENGCIVVVDGERRIVSDRHENEGSYLDVTGLDLGASAAVEGAMFVSDAYGESCYCMFRETEGYLAIAVMPQTEAALSRNMSVGVTSIMQVVVFAALFVMVYTLVRRLVVGNIIQINDSLASITRGELDTTVDVRSHAEFDELSNDINATVDTLKRYIADAAARIDAELAFAKAIQHSALPSVFPPYPNRGEFDIWACMETAKEVGGDFYDFYFIDDDTLAFLIADVSGKGIPAAMFMMRSKTLLKSYAESGMGVEEVLTCANNNLCEGNEEAGMFVTVWMGYLNVKTGELAFGNAGHNPPLIKRADGSFEYLKTRPNLVLAGMEGIAYRRNDLVLEPDDALFLYTDGVTEAVNTDGELYGEDRLLELLNRHMDASVSELCDFVKEDVAKFADGEPQADDITMLSLSLRRER